MIEYMLAETEVKWIVGKGGYTECCLARCIYVWMYVMFVYILKGFKKYIPWVCTAKSGFSLT